MALIVAVSCCATFSGIWYASWAAPVDVRLFGDKDKGIDLVLRYQFAFLIVHESSVSLDAIAIDPNTWDRRSSDSLRFYANPRYLFYRIEYEQRALSNHTYQRMYIVATWPLAYTGLIMVFVTIALLILRSCIRRRVRRGFCVEFCDS